MIRRPSQFLSTLLGVGLAAVSLSACGGSGVTPSPSAAPTLSPTATLAVTALAPTAPRSVQPSVVPSPTEDLHLPHVSAALEDKLPSSIGGIQLQKFSMDLSAYIASYAGGDKPLYVPWLVKFGKTPDDVNLAAALDLTQTESFHVQAIEVPGADASSLVVGFADVARSLKWPVTTRTVGTESILAIVDPATTQAGGLGTAYVLARGDVLYTIVTDDANLLVEALAKITAPA
jgi:hypothetical protein